MPDPVSAEVERIRQEHGLHEPTPRERLSLTAAVVVGVLIGGSAGAVVGFILAVALIPGT